MRRGMISGMRLSLALLVVATMSSIGHAQGGGATSTLSGVVVDTSGAIVPGADVLVRNDDTGAQFRTISAENGTFAIPALSAGTYTATVTVPGFKQAVHKAIKIEIGVPATVRVTMSVGGTSETVLVEAGAQMVQSATANITTTLVSSQISNLPLVSRNALDFIVFLPGVNTTGTNRDSTIVGLPQDMINITIDGVSSMDNYNRTTDGFFSRVRPSLDAIEEASVSTATPGAESAGQGAVQIRFRTRSGSNSYHGSLYEYFRNTSLNANNWFNNRDKAQTYRGTGTPCTLQQLANEFDKCKAPRDREQLNQYGARIGGPVRLPKALLGPLGFDGRDRVFFFFNIEEFRQPNAITRDRTIFNPLAEQGAFQYSYGSEVRQVNLLELAAAKGFTSTMDPTIQKLLADIRASTAQGSLRPQTNPLYQTLTFTNKGSSQNRQITTRFDVNLTAKHTLEVSHSHHRYMPLPYDLTNSRDPAYPGFPNYGVQGSNRFLGSVALRSALSPRLVNELRAGLAGGTTLFSPNLNTEMFKGPLANQDGFALNINAAGLYNAYRHYTPSRRNAPSKTIEETLTWNRGTHSFSFGGGWTEVGLWILNQTMVPYINFGVNTSYDPARVLFDSSNGPKNFPGASSAQLTSARNMYAVLTGRVSEIVGTAYLNEESGRYQYNGDRVQRGYMRELGFFLSDSWRLDPGLTLNYGLRWEMQFPFVPRNNVYTTATIEDTWGVSGVGNLFKPGVLGGKSPQFVQYRAGEGAYNLNLKDFAPSFGFAWSPEVTGGWLGRIVGTRGRSVVRGGYSIAYSRMGMATYADVFNGNPGSFITASRNATLGNLVAQGEAWPLLFRDKSRLGPPGFQSEPSYPMKGAVTDSITVFDPSQRTPYAQSWTFGIQREIAKNTALEVRYVGTRSLQGWTEYNLNELNIVENGLLDEFKLAMINLKANIAAGRASDGFKYRGPGTGTYPLPITLAYFSGVPASQAGDPSKYTSGNFTSSTFVNPLATYNPAPYTYADALDADAGRRANALAAGLPANLLVVNPDLLGGANISGCGAFTRYDSMQVELRRRLSHGLQVQASYVWAKAFSSSRYSFRKPRVPNLGDALPHVFKVNWVYELPVGPGRALFGGSRGVLARVFGGWNFHGIGRVQSGNLMNFGNVRLVGMSPEEFRSAYELRFDDANRYVYVMPDEIIQNTVRAFNATATSPTGYSTSLGAPSGRYIAPANTADCIQVVTGDCAPHRVLARSAKFWNFDLSFVKRVAFTERTNFELRGELLNAFNTVNFSWVANPSSSETWGQVTGTNGEPRRIQVVLRLNF